MIGCDIASQPRKRYGFPEMPLWNCAQRRFIAMITRREFVMSSSALLALGALGWSETYSVLELEAKGPLDDIPRGSETAPVTIIEYASMTCPHCADFEVRTFPKLKEKYIDTGKVRFIMREFPLDRTAAAAFMLA